MRRHADSRTSLRRSSGTGLLAAVLAVITASPLLASDQGAPASRRGRRAASQQSSSNNQNTHSAQSTQPANQSAHHGQAQGRGQGRSPGQAQGQAHAGPAHRGQAHAGPAQGSRSHRVSQHQAPARGRSTPTYRSQSTGHSVVRRSCAAPGCAPYRTHARTVVVAPRPYPVYYAAAPAPVYYAAAAAPVETYVAPAPVDDRFDLGLGLGLVAAAPQLRSGLPLLTGKLRALGQVTPRLGLGLDLDVSSLLLVNHATLSAVASYDLTAGSGVALRPYVSLGAGALNLITPEYLFAGPAVSARAGVELKPWRWLGLSVEAGSVASMMNGLPLSVPYAGGTLALYLL